MEQYFIDRVDGIEGFDDPANYPMTTEDLIAQFGARNVQYPNGEAEGESLEMILDRVGPDMYATPEEAFLALFMGVSADAVGRRYYSDRDPPVLGTEQLPVESF